MAAGASEKKKRKLLVRAKKLQVAHHLSQPRHIVCRLPAISKKRRKKQEEKKDKKKQKTGWLKNDKTGHGYCKCTGDVGSHARRGSSKVFVDPRGHGAFRAPDRKQNNQNNNHHFLHSTNQYAGSGLFNAARRPRLQPLPLDQSNMTLMCFYSRLTRRRDESLGRLRRIRRLPLISRDGAQRRRTRRPTPPRRRGGSGHQSSGVQGAEGERAPLCDGSAFLTH